MSEDEKIFEMLRNAGEKIVELEKKLEKLENELRRNTKIHVQHADWMVENKEMIKRIEKKANADLNHYDELKASSASHTEEIKELKSTKKIDSGIHIILEKRINELKERVEGIYKSIHGIAPDQPDIKEVLREFMKGFRLYKCESKQLDDLIEKQLDKLNGGEKLVALTKSGVFSTKGEDHSILSDDSKPPEKEINDER